MSSYEEQMLRGIRETMGKMDRAMFEGRVRNRFGEFCLCHDKETTSNGFGMGAVPACSVTRQDLGPNDFVRRALPDLLWSDEEKRMIEAPHTDGSET